MPVPAGSKGGYWGIAQDTGLELNGFVQELPVFAASGIFSRVQTLGLYVNSICNLGCEHCYYSVEDGYRTPGGLRTTEVLPVLDEALASEVSLFAFVGKEIFLPGSNGGEKTVAMMRHLANARGAGRPLMLGAVTNGHYLHRYLDAVREVGLQFLDISFEGHDEATHDRIRGQGSFAKSVRNLEMAVHECAADRIFAATTLLSHNVDSLADILDFYPRYGVRHYSVMPVVAIKGDLLAVTLDELERFLEVRLPAKAARLRNADPVMVSLDLDAYVVSRRQEFFSRYFAGSTVKIDTLGNVLVTRILDGVELVMRISLPDPCNGYACITHDGLYFDKGGCLFMKRGYEAHALGSVQAAPFRTLLRRHEENAEQVLAQHGPSKLFGKTADAVLNDWERTTFYALPQLV